MSMALANTLYLCGSYSASSLITAVCTIIIITTRAPTHTALHIHYFAPPQTHVLAVLCSYMFPYSHSSPCPTCLQCPHHRLISLKCHKCCCASVPFSSHHPFLPYATTTLLPQLSPSVSNQKAMSSTKYMSNLLCCMNDKRGREEDEGEQKEKVMNYCHHFVFTHVNVSVTLIGDGNSQQS